MVHARSVGFAASAGVQSRHDATNALVEGSLHKPLRIGHHLPDGSPATITDSHRLWQWSRFRWRIGLEFHPTLVAGYVFLSRAYE